MSHHTAPPGTAVHAGTDVDMLTAKSEKRGSRRLTIVLDGQDVRWLRRSLRGST